MDFERAEQLALELERQGLRFFWLDPHGFFHSYGIAPRIIVKQQPGEALQGGDVAQVVFTTEGQADLVWDGARKHCVGLTQLFDDGYPCVEGYPLPIIYSNQGNVYVSFEVYTPKQREALKAYRNPERSRESFRLLDRDGTIWQMEPRQFLALDSDDVPGKFLTWPTCNGWGSLGE